MIQVQPTGGGLLVVLAAFVGLAVALVLALAVVYRLFAGYRRVGDRGMLGLAVGLALVTAVPILLRIVLPTLTAVPSPVRSLAVSGCELAGLLVVLAVIYDAG